MGRRELAAQVAQEPQLGLVVAEEAPVHQRALGRLDTGGAVLEVDQGAQPQAQRHGLGPELGLDVEGDGVAGAATRRWAAP